MRKYTAEEKIKICEEYISGKSSARELCCKYGLSQGKPPGVFWRWIVQYRTYGDTAFIRNKGNRTYTKEIKEQAVLVNPVVLYFWGRLLVRQTNMKVKNHPKDENRVYKVK